jgi:hypothetical protein
MDIVRKVPRAVPLRGQMMVVLISFLKSGYAKRIDFPMDY